MSDTKAAIKVLTYMAGFPEGTIIEPEHQAYSMFETWAEMGSITTDASGKGAMICEFAQAEEPDQKKTPAAPSKTDKTGPAKAGASE